MHFRIWCQKVFINSDTEEWKKNKEPLSSNYRGIFTEPLASNGKGTFTEPLPIKGRGIFTEQLPSNNKGEYSDTRR
jgi:hypothetical protein